LDRVRQLPWAALEDLAVVKQAVEHGSSGGEGSFGQNR